MQGWQALPAQHDMPGAVLEVIDHTLLFTQINRVSKRSQHSMTCVVL